MDRRRALRQECSLKHRADGRNRHVPTPPGLASILRAHLAAAHGHKSPR
ncbi:hypothetical protein ACU635_14560 [[Actinomadura] parvosata]